MASKKQVVELVALQCGECKRRNYTTSKNRRNTQEKLEFKKYCPFDRKHTLHKETKIKQRTKAYSSVGRATVSKTVGRGFKSYCACETVIRKERKMRLIRFIKECVAELKKVVWPGRDDVISSVKVVIISTIIVALILGLIDFILSRGMLIIF